MQQSRNLKRDSLRPTTATRMIAFTARTGAPKSAKSSRSCCSHVRLSFGRHMLSFALCAVQQQVAHHLPRQAEVKPEASSSLHHDRRLRPCRRRRWRTRKRAMRTFVLQTTTRVLCTRRRGRGIHRNKTNKTSTPRVDVPKSTLIRRDICSCFFLVRVHFGHVCVLSV